MLGSAGFQPAVFGILPKNAALATGKPVVQNPRNSNGNPLPEYLAYHHNDTILLQDEINMLFYYLCRLGFNFTPKGRA